jgi:hypothetical protein
MSNRLEDSGHPTSARFEDSGQPTSAVVQFASTLAFAIPPPEGIVLSAVLGLFGSLINSGPSLIETIQQLLTSAVKALETFFEQENIQRTDSDAQAFFLWLQTLSNVPQAQPESVANLKSRIQILDSTFAFAQGSLFNNLILLSDEQYVQTQTLVHREADSAVGALFLTITAIVAAQKMIYFHSAAIVSACAPSEDGTFQSSEFEQDYSDFLTRGNLAARTISSFYSTGTVDPTPRISLADVAASDLSSTFFDSLRSAYGPGSALPWTSIAQYAVEYGWAAAMRLLTIYRQMQRVLCLGGDIGSVSITPGASDFEHSWIFTDTYTNNSIYVPLTADEIMRSNDQPDSDSGIYPQRITMIQNIVGGLSVPPGWIDDLSVCDNWVSNSSELVQKSPKDAPPMSMIVSTWGGNPNIDNSQWTTALKVQYKVAYLSDNGVGVSSAWGAPITVAGQWEPNFQDLPSSTDTQLIAILIYRQFIFEDVNHDPDNFGVPKLVATLPLSAATWTDTDHAIFETASS